jgi:hypothetical protein
MFAPSLLSMKPALSMPALGGVTGLGPDDSALG